MLIGEASRKTCLRLWFYSDEGLVHPRKDPFTGYRFFTEKDLTRLRFLKRARQFNFSIEIVLNYCRFTTNRIVRVWTEDHCL